MSIPSMDQQQEEQEQRMAAEQMAASAALEAKDSGEEDLNGGHSSNGSQSEAVSALSEASSEESSSSSSVEGAVEVLECGQQCVVATVSTTQSTSDITSRRTVDTLTPQSSVVCRPEQDHEGVGGTKSSFSPFFPSLDNNQSTIQYRTEEEERRNSSHRFSTEQQHQPQVSRNDFASLFSSIPGREERQREQERGKEEEIRSAERRREENLRSEERWKEEERKEQERRIEESSHERRREEEIEIRKLREDLKRLRIHLIQVEDGYTKELLESQEREQELVSKLSAAEERIKWQEERLRESSDALKAAGRLVTSIDDKEVSIKKLKDELAKKTEEIVVLQNMVAELKETNDYKLDKQLVKSLLMNYFTSPPELKKDVARLLVRILDFSETELIKSGLMPGSGHSVQQEAVQVATQFVQFLERESIPRNEPSAVPNLPTLVPPSPLSSSSSTRSNASSTRSSFSGSSPQVGMASSATSMQNTSSYKPIPNDAVKQLAKDLLRTSDHNNPYTNY